MLKASSGISETASIHKPLQDQHQNNGGLILSRIHDNSSSNQFRDTSSEWHFDIFSCFSNHFKTST